MNDFEGNLIGLIDDDGNELYFELIDRVTVNGEEYVALVPEYENPQDSLAADGQLVILKVVIDEELGEETYATIDNELEFDEVAAELEKRFEQGEDFEILQ